ncbi:hypothetical protein CAPTEDRAFT_223845 [Capitella teleta]|uniref:MAM domain-containing protein n=1 Tax=Capitella teleta TaxID=283909 RepID=R7U4I1_CAPTE|nr:hypothetical protein CAPTEDRAFT_223845 [Capitella teleta]|eukprot:ELT98075.1 hypothetical protein CAPTEDRAFT_223845 [Capitella teleta]
MASYIFLAAITLASIQISTAQFQIKCTFETNNCPSLLQSVDDDYNFNYGSKGTPSEGTGPTSGADGSNNFVFLEASGKRVDSSARLSTGTLGFEGDVCVKFQYSMRGTAINKLSVLLVEDGKNDVTLWSKTGSQGNDWVSVQEDYSITSMNQMIVFEALVGATFSSDIALDNIEVFSGSCSSGPQAGTTPRSSGTTNSRGMSTTPSSGYPMIWRCDFDSDYNDTCKVAQMQNTMNWNWLRQSGSTPSSDTGPPSSYDGEYYFYVEASGTSLTPGSQTTPSGKLLCLKLDFYYFMYGSSLGILEVKAVGEDYDETVVTINGNKGEQWLKSSTEMDVPTNAITFQFIGTRGDGFRSDIAVDRIKVYDCSSERTQGGETTQSTFVTATGSAIPTEKATTANAGSGSSTTTAPNANANNVQVNPTYVSIDDGVPGSVVCKVMNTASLPYLWNGYKWYDPSGNLITTSNTRAIVDTVYHTPTATSGDFWTSTLYVDAVDYTQNGQYVCEVNYNNDVTRRTTLIDVKDKTQKFLKNFKEKYAKLAKNSKNQNAAKERWTLRFHLLRPDMTELDSMLQIIETIQMNKPEIMLDRIALPARKHARAKYHTLTTSHSS